MAKRNTFYLIHKQAVYDEVIVSARDEEDKMFCLTANIFDRDDSSSFRKFKEASAFIYRIEPDEETLLKTFKEEKELFEKEFYKFLKQFDFKLLGCEKSLSEIPWGLHIDNTPVKWKEEKYCLGEFDLSEDEYNLLPQDIVVQYNSDTYHGFADNSPRFDWSQLRSGYHPREVTGFTEYSTLYDDPDNPGLRPLLEELIDSAKQ